MTAGLQPFLDDRTIVLDAPTQAWSGRGGDIGDAPIDGVYHGDTRFIGALELTYAAADGAFVRPEWVRTTAATASRVRFDGLLRGVDDAWPDPKVRLVREREVRHGRMTETLTVRSHLASAVTVRLQLRVDAQFAPLQEVKAGAAAGDPGARTPLPDGVAIAAGALRLELSASGAQVGSDSDAVVLDWTLEVPAFGTATATWHAEMTDAAIVVRGVTAPAPWHTPGPVPGADPRLGRWLDRALGDLAALRLALPDAPEDVFFAAGAPWFFTLFGRDSLWAARLILPLDASVAASTLRVLARLQGTAHDPQTAEDPGKIMHELRAGTLSMPGEGIVLPPLYYGTVDATPLWVCLLADVADIADAMAPGEVEALLPNLEAALGWIRASAGDDGFLDYIDETGHGLSNQGWKDSGDSIQWRDGSLAQGPIALC